MVKFNLLFISLLMVLTTAIENFENGTTINHRLLAPGQESSCVTKTLGRMGKGKPYPAIWWLHIPKCGSSFSNSAILYPRSKYRSPFPINDINHPKDVQHQILKASNVKELSRIIPQVAVMFRQPEQRLLSSYYYKLKLKNKCCWGDWGWNKMEQDQVLRDIERHKGPSITMSKFGGCQTKMIIGHGCMSSLHKVSKFDIDMAIKTMLKFKFVGILEEWTLSMCLFNRIMTGHNFIFKSQLINNRPTKGNTVSLYDIPANFKRDDDMLLYSKALLRFRNEILKYNITIQNCPIKCG